jgi:hypothetical protein
MDNDGVDDDSFSQKRGSISLLDRGRNNEKAAEKNQEKSVGQFTGAPARRLSLNKWGHE